MDAVHDGKEREGAQVVFPTLWDASDPWGTAPAPAPTGATTGTMTGSDDDARWLAQALHLAARGVGRVSPRPLAGCVAVSAAGEVVGEGWYTRERGSAVVQALRFEGGGSPSASPLEGGTVVVTVEPTEADEVAAIEASGVARVVVGLRRPAGPLGVDPGGVSVSGGALDQKCAQGAGFRVEYVAADSEGGRRCAAQNVAWVHYVRTGRPYGILKFAMTLDGKIATSTGHSRWISGPDARRTVHSIRSAVDAVVVGGATVRRDDPNLLSTNEAIGVDPQPMRVVLSRSLDVPAVAKCWDVSVSPTLVLTEAKSLAQHAALVGELRGQGVEVLGVPSLTPAVACRLLSSRGCVSVLWECGGGLAAPAIADGTVHRVVAFIATKIVGGAGRTPSPVGHLGILNMNQALPLSGTRVSLTAEGDVMVEGDLRVLPAPPSPLPSYPVQADLMDVGDTAARRLAAIGHLTARIRAGDDARYSDPALFDASLPPEHRAIFFWKASGTFAQFSNFSLHPVTLQPAHPGYAAPVEWPTVEHFYQAAKFDDGSPEAFERMEHVRCRCALPEDAASYGRDPAHAAHIRADWDAVKRGVMAEAVRAKFARHKLCRTLLLATGALRLIEDSPRDYVWACGQRGDGQNWLGQLLEDVRDEALVDNSLQFSDSHSPDY